MILAAHQPNFMPYMGFFYKMYMCDVFTLSDTVQFSTRGFQNYNFVDCQGKRTKITVPVSNKGGAIYDVQLADWEHNRRKIWRTLEQNYCKAKYFKELAPIFEHVLMRDFGSLSELNEQLIIVIHDLFGFECKLVRESDLQVTGFSPTAQIADICAKTGCETYLSGIGAKEYLDEKHLSDNGYNLLWSNYQTIGNDLSAFDYLMNAGTIIPYEWAEDKEALLRGRI